MSLGIRFALWAVLIVGVGAGAWAVVHTYNAKIAEVEELKAQRDQEKAAAEGWRTSALYWQNESERRDRALAARERERAAISKETERLNAELEAAKQHDQTLRAWTEAPLPQFVIEQLRTLSADPGSTERPAGENPREPDGGDRRTALAGIH